MRTRPSQSAICLMHNAPADAIIRVVSGMWLKEYGESYQDDVFFVHEGILDEHSSRVKMAEDVHVGVIL